LFSLLKGCYCYHKPINLLFLLYIRVDKKMACRSVMYLIDSWIYMLNCWTVLFWYPLFVRDTPNPLIFVVNLALCCLFFFDIRILITPLVSSYSSYILFIRLRFSLCKRIIIHFLLCGLIPNCSFIYENVRRIYFNWQLLFINHACVIKVYVHVPDA
jgi:hypothetical protein